MKLWVACQHQYRNSKTFSQELDLEDLRIN